MTSRSGSTTVRSAADGRPVSLYAHSMGGLIAAGYLLTDRPRPDLDRVVGARVGLDAGRLEEAVRTDPRPDRAHAVGPERCPVGRRCRAIRRSADAPRPTRSTGGRALHRFGAEALAEQARVRAGARSIGGPTLVLHGLDDGLVPPASTEVFEGAPGVERRTYPGLRHELHNEPEGPAILDEVVAWLRERARLPAQPNTASGERLAR